MKIVVLSEDSSVIWERDARHGCGLTNARYLVDGTQEKIASALREALAEAEGQLLCSRLQIADVVADIRASAAKVDRYVPETGRWNGDARGQHLVESSVEAMLSSAPETLEIRVISEPHIALVVAGHNDNVTRI
jgi:hypothetical protein